MIRADYVLYLYGLFGVAGFKDVSWINWQPLGTHDGAKFFGGPLVMHDLVGVIDKSTIVIHHCHLHF